MFVSITHRYLHSIEVRSFQSIAVFFDVSIWCNDGNRLVYGSGVNNVFTQKSLTAYERKLELMHLTIIITKAICGKRMNYKDISLPTFVDDLWKWVSEK